ncbi:MAG: hypothetical protein COA47_02055 [Robiginitomaculum sp.]|nr:MAG: hypothetical protein COA47_02055 [Robiginitomaculum sp.]
MLSHIRISEITEQHLLGLIENKVPENHTLEFKRQTYGTNDKDKKEFLKDISAFANADGGDLIIGIAENNDGVANSLAGMPATEAGKEHERLEQIARNGLEPKIEFQSEEIQLEDGKTIFIFRIPASDIGPHRVKFAGTNRYYIRGSKTTDEPDVEKLRKMFLAPYLREQKIRSFVDERIKLVAGGNGPTQLETDDWVSIHIIPLRKVNLAFGYGNLISQKLSKLFHPMRQSGWSQTSNLDGILIKSTNYRMTHSYVQLFRDGSIEAVCCNWIRNESIDNLNAHGHGILNSLLSSTLQYISQLENLDVKGPYLIFWSLKGFKGVRIEFENSSKTFNDSSPIDRATLRIPEVKIDTLDSIEDAREKLRPCLDTLFQASGFERCKYFTEDGEWNPTR